MIEKIIRDYLNDNLDDVKAHMERPKNPGNKYVLIEKTGAHEEDHIRHSTIAIQSIAPSLYGAAALDEDVIRLMMDAISLDDVAKVELNSDYNFTNWESKQYRYQAVFDITHY